MSFKISPAADTNVVDQEDDEDDEEEEEDGQKQM